MEAALNRTAKEYSRYGSATHKQVYIYGGLDPGPTMLNRNFGMAWGIGGWLLTPFLERSVDPARCAQRVARRTQDHVRQPLHEGSFPRRRRCSPKPFSITASRRPARSTSSHRTSIRALLSIR